MRKNQINLEAVIEFALWNLNKRKKLYLFPQHNLAKKKPMLGNSILLFKSSKSMSYRLADQEFER